MNEPRRKDEYTCPGCSQAREEGRREGRERGNRLEAALRGLVYWVDRTHRDCGASIDPKVREAMALSELALDHSEDWRDASPARDLARRVGELEEDREALLALGRAVALWRDPPDDWSGFRADEELVIAYAALPDRARERLEGEGE